MVQNLDSSTRTTTAPLNGVVYKKLLGAYHVNLDGDDGRVMVCSISSKLRKHLLHSTADRSSVRHQPVQEVRDIKTVDPVAIGDEVLVKDAGDETGVITDILPRRTSFSRPAAGKKPLEHVIVANLDQVVAVFAAAQPEPRWNLLDRYLASAEASELDALVVITKMDVGDEAAIDEAMAVYCALGYRVILTSAASGRGVDELRDALANRLSVFVGKSGVGKSSLLNAVQPGLGQKVGDVSDGRVGKGKHTTTHLEMFPLDTGGHVVDTPGVRVFGMWEVDDSDIAALYREMQPLVGACRFGADCLHDSEPGCAIKRAVESGAIHPRRYDSYLRILHGELD